MRFFIAVCILVTACANFAPAQSPAPNNYADPKAWLCRPAGHDACEADMTATVIEASGKLRREAWRPNNNAQIDCFYVYPTISTDPTPNSDMTADTAEINVIHQQFARFASVCRPYAPLYRQVTLAGLRAMMAGGGRARLDSGLAYDDIRDAWRYYLEHDNQGRGFVLIGHSQGSYLLAELIRREIDGKPIQARMISALLPGATMFAPKGKEVGGSFQQVPFCQAAVLTGCVVAYSAYRDTVQPPANTLFGKVNDPAMSAVCVNPAALAGGTAPLRAYFSSSGQTITSRATPPVWVRQNAGNPVETPWVSLPGLLTAECATNEFATFLKIAVHGNPEGSRANEIFGDLRTPNGDVRAEWGLHLVDVNLAIGNLIQLVERQAGAWLSQQKN